MKSLKRFQQHAEKKALAPRPLQKCEELHLIQKEEVLGLILVIAEKPGVAQSIAKVLGAASCWDVLQTWLTIKKITKKQVQGITRKKICKSVQPGRAPRTAST